MEKMMESYRETMEKLKERSGELEQQMAALLPGVERDKLEARNRILQQEVREMRGALAMMADYLGVENRGSKPTGCRVSGLVQQEEAVS